MYDTIAKIANLTFQGDEIYENILPSTNVDMSTDDIVKFAQQESISTPAQKEVDAIKFINERYPTLTPFQKNIAQIMARGGMNMLLRKYTDPQITESLKKMIPVFGVILDKRNALVVDTITASSNRNIYIHYGAMHFAGILE